MAAQAIDLRGGGELGPGAARVFAFVRSHVDKLEEDRASGPDVSRLAEAIARRRAGGGVRGGDCRPQCPCATDAPRRQEAVLHPATTTSAALVPSASQSGVSQAAASASSASKAKPARWDSGGWPISVALNRVLPRR